ncbi:MAG: hypothetical protein H6Q00_1596 [Holophagaceae bacterium]|nr:hypothetical protein [Holophagaceae bacterium]
MKPGGPKNTHGDPHSDPEEPGGGNPGKCSEGDSNYTHDLALLPLSVSPIPPSSRSTLQARANEEMEWARQNRQQVFEAYAGLEESMDGRIVNGDLFVTLLPSVYSNPQLVHTLDLADMNYLAVDLYEASVARNSSTGANTVVAMVGAAGIGKSTRAKELLEKHAGQVNTVLDSNGANWLALLEAINVATRKGCNVDILYVGGDVAGAVSRTVSRSKADSRVVPSKDQAFLHRAAPINFLRAIEEIRQEGIGFAAYDARNQCFSDDMAALATSDLNDPINNLAGITSILKESFHVQQLEPDAQRAFLSAEEEQP